MDQLIAVILALAREIKLFNNSFKSLLVIAQGLLFLVKILNRSNNNDIDVIEAIDMVNVNGYEVREGLYYHKEHFWAKVEKELVRFGTTDYGQKALKEVVFVELPSAGDAVKQNEPYGTVESVKAVVDLIAPVSGTVKEVNEKLRDNPEPINKDPYGEGWLIAVTPSNLKTELDNIMAFKAAVDWYKEVVK